VSRFSLKHPLKGKVDLWRTILPLLRSGVICSSDGGGLLPATIEDPAAAELIFGVSAYNAEPGP